MINNLFQADLWNTLGASLQEFVEFDLQRSDRKYPFGVFSLCEGMGVRII